TFIKNLGLPELLDNKLDKTGGKITGQLNIEYVGGQGLTTNATSGTSVYHELYLLGKMVAWWGIVNSNEVVIENRATGQKLFIGPGGFKIDGKNIATTEQIPGVSKKWKNVKPDRYLDTLYTNTDASPRIVSFTKQYASESGQTKVYVDGLMIIESNTGAVAASTMPAFFIVPPQSEYMIEAPSVGIWVEC
ncbi:hypothetical protein ACSKAN_003734, partial [Morganella morganii]